VAHPRKRRRKGRNQQKNGEAKESFAAITYTYATPDRTPAANSTSDGNPFKSSYD
jgi:hypothetical protein